MKIKQDIGIAIIYRNKTIDKKVKNIFIKSYKESLKFFPKKPNKFNIFICDNEEEYRRYSNPYYTKWSTSVCLGEKGIATRSPELVEKIGKWKRKDFQNIMNHEISHVFWYQLFHSWSPLWFFEGLASYIGNNFPINKKELKEIIIKENISAHILDYRYLRRNFKTGHFPRYQIWQSFFMYLIEENKEDSIKKFLIAFPKNPTKEDYQRVFKKIFGMSDKKLFNKYLTKVLK